ncbi:histidinol dehydrogenase-domain-containing protein [Lipomyces oligophaga]|uniref:histidinol dehydrogenase-domain-containing protein n=1 Tax=Lipomyces oligophaga TaxID=45792 RepID=UPI0034CEC75D
MVSVAPCFPASNLDASLQSGLYVLGRAFVVVSSASDVSLVKDFLSINFGIVDVVAVISWDAVSVDDIIGLLDAGLEAVSVPEKCVKPLVDAGVPFTRIIVPGSSYDSAAVGVTVSSTDNGISELASKAAKTLIPDLGPQTVFVTFPESATVDSITKITTLDSTIAVIPFQLLSTDVVSSDNKISVAKIIASSLTSDRSDGLFTTLVVDVHDTALGLVYSSEESLAHAISTRTGVYQSRKRGLWFKGQTSGAVQNLRRVSSDCDGDCLKFVVEQTGAGFCHNETFSCFGGSSGLAGLEKTLLSRKKDAPEGSYTKRIFADEALLKAKIMEEAEELTEAKTKSAIAWEMADLLYFAFAKAVRDGVSLEEVERNLDSKSRKITRRKGDAKGKWAEQNGISTEKSQTPKVVVAPAPSVEDNKGKIELTRVDVSAISDAELTELLRRPAQKNANILNLVTPIVEAVRSRGDAALLEFTAKFDKAKLDSPIIRAPFPEELMQLDDETRSALDLSIENVRRFHAAQLETEPLVVETRPGVVCSRFARPIDSVALYVPGGTAILPSTALMLGVPAMVAGCKNIILASPPRADGTLTPEVVYVAHKVGASMIVLAGGAQAVAAMAYGTESIPKVNKILGPGNQFVTTAKMLVQNDTSALVSIDMPAGPSEVLVIADKTSNPAFVASDLLSQAEHGVDSQVVLIAVDLITEQLQAIEDQVHEQAMRLPRVEIVRGAIKHSRTFLVKTVEQAIELSNRYAPEHLIISIENANKYVDAVKHAGSVFVGEWSPESCGDYSSGTNHTLPTYGYAQVYSGVNTASFMKHLTSQELTPEGLKNIGPAVVRLADVEGLDAHGNAVRVRLSALEKK